ARLARGGARRAEARPRVPAQGRCLHRRRDQHLARVQGGEGAEPGAAAADADGVRALLRYLIFLSKSVTLCLGVTLFDPAPPSVGDSPLDPTRKNPRK